MLSNKPESQWSESHLVLEITLWIRSEHPNTPFRVDIAADMPLPRVHAGRLKVLHGKWSKGYPDINILSSRGKFSGLFVEAKTLKAGLVNTPHTNTQKSYHNELRLEGYKVEFGIGFDNIKSIVTKYMKKQGRVYE